MGRQIPSTEFRVTYHSLDEPVDVTVLGRVIGRYIPSPHGRYWEPVEEPPPPPKFATRSPFAPLPPENVAVLVGTIVVLADGKKGQKDSFPICKA